MRGLLLASGLVVSLSMAGAGAGVAGDPMPLAQSESVVLAPGRTDVRLDFGSVSLQARLQSIGGGRRVVLRLQGLKTDQSPGVTYNVYLNLQQGQTPHGTSDPHYLGTFSFFDTEARDRSFEIDVTDKLRRLATSGNLGSDATLAFVPAGDPAAHARPRIGRIFITAR